MELAMITAQQVLSLFILILVGAVCCRIGIVRAEGRKMLSNLLVYLVIPSMVLDSYMTGNDGSSLGNLLQTFGLSTVVMILGLVITFLATIRQHHSDIPVIRFGCAFSNAGYMGFPLIRALFGEEGLLYASAFFTIYNLLMWSVGVVIVSGKFKWKEVARSIYTCPGILAVCLGLLIYLAGIPVPEVIKTPVNMIGNMNTPISMMITGSSIAASNLRELFKNRRLLQVIMLRMAVIPLAGAGLFGLMGLRGLVPMIVLILQACPCATITTTFAIQYGHDESLAAGSVVFTTILSMVCLPLYTFLLTCVL